MRRDFIVLNFIKLSAVEKVSKGRSIETEMRGNPKFPTPDITMDQLKAADDTLETRILAAATGGKEETALMHQAESVWDDLMRKIVAYVERIADGDPAIMLSAGFDLAKQPAPKQHPEFSVELGEISGSVLLKRQAVEGAKSYIWQMSTVPFPEKDSDWTIIKVTAQCTAEIFDLISAAKYWFRVAVVTREGTGAFSDPIMQVVV